MKRDQKRIAYQFLGLLVPVLTIISPNWISIAGVAPRWAELWLLPWSLEEGPWAGAFGGLCLGMILDSINLSGTTQVPALMMIGYCWGLVGEKKQFHDQNFSLGLLAWMGSLASGLFIWIQQLFLIKGSVLLLFNAWAFYTLFSASIMTALIAPLFCSWMLRIFFQGKT